MQIRKFKPADVNTSTVVYNDNLESSVWLKSPGMDIEFYNTYLNDTILNLN